MIQTTPYIGQPAYKTMGGRAAYTLATAVFIGLAGGLGWFAAIVRLDSRGGLLSDPGLRRAGDRRESFRATPARHYAALALAILPALAYLATIPLKMASAGAKQAAALRGAADARAALPGQRLHRDQPALGLVAGGDPRSADVSGGTVSGCGRRVQPRGRDPFALVARGDRLAVGRRRPYASTKRTMLCQSPYHWAGGYLLAAVVLAVLGAWEKS